MGPIDGRQQYKFFIALHSKSLFTWKKNEADWDMSNRVPKIVMFKHFSCITEL